MIYFNPHSVDVMVEIVGGVLVLKYRESEGPWPFKFPDLELNQANVLTGCDEKEKTLKRTASRETVGQRRSFARNGARQTAGRPKGCRHLPIDTRFGSFNSTRPRRARGRALTVQKCNVFFNGLKKKKVKTIEPESFKLRDICFSVF